MIVNDLIFHFVFCTEYGYTKYAVSQVSILLDILFICYVITTFQWKKCNYIDEMLRSNVKDRTKHWKHAEMDGYIGYLSQIKLIFNYWKSI